MADYDKLKGGEGVDWDAVRQYAKAKIELVRLEREYKKLDHIVCQNQNLSEYTWKTKVGEVIPITDLFDDHLKNIVAMLERTEGAYIPEALAEEYTNRGFGYINIDRNESKDEGEFDF